MRRATTDGWKRIHTAVLFVGVLVVSATSPMAEARQRAYPVVSVSCGSDLRLCRALVQALSELAPSHLYRINPKPQPPLAFDLHLEISRDTHARLRWQEDGQGALVARADMSETELARALVHASPGLARALDSHQ